MTSYTLHGMCRLHVLAACLLTMCLSPTPRRIAIIGSGYIGLEFSDVYTALGTEVTFIEVSQHGVGCMGAALALG